ncbi:MAG: hypothetical protein U0800_07155 [Isosphaeraceae bacterium]
MDRPRPLGLAIGTARGLLALALAALSLTADVQAGQDPAPTQAPAPAPAPSPTRPEAEKAAPKAEAVPLERRPYKIRAWITVRPGAMLDARGRALAITGWEGLARRLVGAPWALDVSDDPAPQSSTPLESLVAETIAPQAEGFDKAWIIRIDGNGGGFRLSGRAADVHTARLNAHRHPRGQIPRR